MSKSQLDKAVLVEDGQLRDHEYTTAQDLLRDRPRGAYTALTLLQGNQAVGWQMHCERLAHSLHRIAHSSEAPTHAPSPDGEGQQPLPPSSVIGDILLPCVRLARDELLRQQDPADIAVVILLHHPCDRSREENGSEPVRVTVWANWLRGQLRNGEPICVEVVGPGRNLADAKDSAWAADRVPLQANLSQGSAEGLLISAEGGLVEGLVSNFFVVTLGEDGKPLLQTSPAEEGAASLVLDGVMRRLVLEACHMLHIPVQLSVPLIKSASKWSEAFVTNSLHGIRAINVIRSAGDVEGSGVIWSCDFAGAPGPIVQRLRGQLKIVQLHHAVHI